MLSRLKDDGRYHLGSLFYRTLRGSGQAPGSVLVNGTPKCGTTWMLLLVGSLPGYRVVGNFQGQIERYGQMRPGEVVHGHDRHSAKLADLLCRNGIKVVVLIRDPRDQLVSRVYHIRRDSGHAWHQALADMSVDEALMACIEGRPGLPSTRALFDISQSWMNSASDCLCVRYEALLDDTAGEYRRVLDFLGVRLPGGLLETIVRRNRFSRLATGRRFWKPAAEAGASNTQSHFRKGIAGDWRNHFKPEHVERFKVLVGDKLIELGYEPDLAWQNTRLPEPQA